MEYIKDRLFSVKYKKHNIEDIVNGKIKTNNRFTKWLEKDEYFTLVILTSIIVLFVDFLFVKNFIDIIKLIP